MTPEKKSDFSITSISEGRTGGGQLVQFGCVHNMQDEVKSFLKKYIRDFSFPETHRVNVEHGGYGRYSRYQIKQHKYGASDGEDGSFWYGEVLEIADPLDDRGGIVLHTCSSDRGSVFSEWETVADARKAYQKLFTFPSHEDEKHLSALAGFKRYVHCGDLSPWFYAVGHQEVVGDYALPEGMQDDQVYKIGEKFVVYDRESELPILKTCLGCRFVPTHTSRDGFHTFGSQVPARRIVYWHDGTTWDENRDSGRAPIPAHKDEVWIAEAMTKFQALLSGKSERLSVNFADGSKFVGRFVPAKDKKVSPEGNYFIVVKVKGEIKAREGWVDFTPTAEIPNVIAYVTKQMEQRGAMVETIAIKSSKATPAGKKWHGVYHTRGLSS